LKSNDYIPAGVIHRLPRYYKLFCDLNREGTGKISSKSLADRLALTASQVRQDFNCFGNFGQQGYGYNVVQLQHELGAILGLNHLHKAILVGTDNFGRAVSELPIELCGFQLIGIFDKKESVTGQILRGLPIRHTNGLDDFCRENLPEMAIVSVSKGDAEALVKQLIRLGIKGFWNLSSYDFKGTPPDIAVEHLLPTDSLISLCFSINRL